MDDYRVVCASPLALWREGDPPVLRDAPDWRQVSDDLLAALHTFGLEHVTAVGHSLGGIASMLAVLDEPQRFRALILLDPTFLDETIVEMIATARQHGVSDQHPLAQAALHRKRHFATAQAFYERYRHHPLFADWDDEALRLYAQHGTESDREGVHLTWSPEWEAHYFSTGLAAMWRIIPTLDGVLPTLILRGSTSDTYSAASAQRVQQLLPRATHITIDGYGHLFPQAAPYVSAQVIREWLETLP